MFQDGVDPLHFLGVEEPVKENLEQDIVQNLADSPILNSTGPARRTMLWVVRRRVAQDIREVPTTKR